MLVVVDAVLFLVVLGALVAIRCARHVRDQDGGGTDDGADYTCHDDRETEGRSSSSTTTKRASPPTQLDEEDPEARDAGGDDDDELPSYSEVMREG